MQAALASIPRGQGHRGNSLRTGRLERVLVPVWEERTIFWLSKPFSLIDSQSMSPQTPLSLNSTRDLKVGEKVREKEPVACCCGMSLCAVLGAKRPSVFYSHKPLLKHFPFPRLIYLGDNRTECGWPSWSGSSLNSKGTLQKEVALLAHPDAIMSSTPCLIGCYREQWAFAPIDSERDIPSQLSKLNKQTNLFNFKTDNRKRMLYISKLPCSFFNFCIVQDIVLYFFHL